MYISSKKILIFSLLIFILSVLRIFNFIAPFFGVVLLIINFYLLFLSIDPIFKFLKIAVDNFVKILFLLAYYSISLSVIYYTTGLNKYTLLIWLVINFVIVFIFCLKNKNSVSINFNIKINKENLKDLEFLLIFVIFIYLIIYFFRNQITDGNATPWPKQILFVIIPFFLSSFFLLKRYLNGKVDLLLSFLYFFIIISVISISYILSYGYDTLIHQGALNYIAQYGRIEPLTPFYIGQYVLEVLINIFSGISFTFIERWLVPALFLILIFFGGNYFLKKIKLGSSFLIIPISVVLLFPSIFSYSSPYALSLLWGMIAILFLSISKEEISNVRIALICSIVSFIIHPFVGLNILTWSLGLYFINKNKVSNKKKTWFLRALFLVSSIIVVVAFIFYNWIQDNGFNIYNPLYFILNFSSIFNDPAWYLRDEYPWWLGVIYFYEKILFFLAFLFALYLRIKNFKKEKELVLLISISSFLSAWFFVSGFKIDNYFYGDQFNYGYRLIQVSKWFLWPIILILLINFFDYIKKQKYLYKYLVALIFAFLITVSWYLTYPRQDNISHMNTNSIRKVDYKAIDLIYDNESGKKGYVVLSNQILGAGAILRYSFGPYYRSGDENMFYYSLPWGSKMGNIYNEIMTLESNEEYNINKSFKKIQGIIKPLGINKFYFIYTDAWSPRPGVVKELNKQSSNRWNIDNKVFVLLFDGDI